MDAPNYPPAMVFVQPVRLARILDTRNTAIADLMANPAAWAMVLREAPEMAFLVTVGALKQHLGNFSFQDLVAFGAIKPDALDRIDVGLKALGPQL